MVKIDLSTLSLKKAAIVPGGVDSLVLLPVGYDLPVLPITATVNGVPIQNPTYVLDSRDPLSIETNVRQLTVKKRSATNGVWVRAILQAGVNTGGVAPMDSILVRAVTKTVVTPRPTVVVAALKDTIPLLAYALGIPKASGAIDTIGVPDFTYRSTNPAVATVDANGKLATIGNGSATVYAKSDFDSVAFTVTVKQQIAAWRLSQDTTTVAAIGDTGSVTATALDLRGQVVDTTVTNAQPSWTLTDPSLATLQTNGKSASMIALVNGSTALNAQTVTTDTSVTRFLGGATLVKKVGQLRVSQIATAMLSVGLDSTTIEAPFLTFKFRARPLDRRGIDIVGGAAITWSSTNPAVARVDTSGTVEALTVGTAVVKAQRDGAVKNFPVVVTNPPKTITASPKPISFVSLLDTARIIATVRNARPDTLFTAPVTFTSVDPLIATITPVGPTGSNIARVQGVATGTTRIIITAAAGVVDTVVINVANIATQVTLSPRAITLASINDSTSPTPDVRNARGNAMSASVVTWVSRDPSIMTVTATGIVIARAQGTATLVASSGTGFDSIPVSVTNARASVRLSPRGTVAFASLPQTLTIKAATYNARGDTIPATAAATWTTSNATVASISTFSGDVVTLNINAVGTALLTATVPTGGGGTVTDTLRINATNSIVNIGINPPGVSFTSVGRTQQMIATATNVAGGTINGVAFTWASSTPSIASVTATGLVTALAPGSAYIRASSGGKVDSAVVTVSSAPDTVRITSVDTLLTSVGDSFQPGVLFKDAAGNTLARGTVSWGTTDTTVAKVSNAPTNPAGLVLATGIGSVRISATSAAATGPNDTLRVRSILVTVRNDPFLVTLNRSSSTLTALGQTLSYTATVTNSRGAPISNQAAGLTWSSSNSLVATVDASGLATAIDTGTVTITATTNVSGATTRTATATLTITNSAASVTVTPQTFTISGATRTRQLSAAATNGAGAPVVNPVITWSSSAPLIATVSTTGLVTGLANGTATLTATVNGVAGTSTVTVLAGSASPVTSTISTSAASVTANGAAAATITVQLKDANGNNLTTGTDVVTMATTFGSLSSVSGGNGTYTASLTASTPGTATITATVNSAVITTTPPTVTFVPGPATALSSTISVASTSGVADGSTITLTIQAKDAQGNNRNVAGDAIVISRSGVGTIAAATGTTNSSGVYTTTISSTTTGTASISATLNGNTIVTGNPVITFAPGAAAKLGVATQPAGASTGIAFQTQPAVQVLDANNNLVTSSAAPIAVAIATGGGTLSGTATVNASSGIASFAGLALTGTAGPRTLTFTSSGLTAATSASFALGVGAPATLAFQVAPSTTANSGQPLATQPVVLVVDIAGNQDTTVNGTLNVSAPGVTLSGNSVAIVKGKATLTALTLSGTANSYVVTFSDGTRSVQSTVIVSAGAATSLAFGTAPSTSASSGAALSAQPVVRVLDASNNLVLGASGTITVTTGAGAALASATATITSGIATFSGLSATGTAGSYTLTFSDGTLSVTSPLTLGAGAPASIAILTQPANASSGASFGTQPVIRVLDGSGNIVTGSTASVVAAIASGGGTLGGNATINAAGGVASFTNLSITGTTGARTLSFTSGVLPVVTSASFTLAAGAATQLAIVASPPATATNDALLGTITVQLKDAAGNNVSQSGTTVNASIASGGGSLQGTVAATTDPSGLATYTDLRIRGTLGSRTLAFSAASLTTATSTAINVNTAGALAQLVVAQAPTAAPPIGAPFATQPGIQLADVSGNAVASGGVPVTVSIFTGAGSLTGTLTANSSGTGLGSFTNVGITGVVGARVLQFTAGSLTVNAATITPVAGAAAVATIGTAPTNVAVAATMGVNPTVTITDAGTNPVVGTTVTLSASGGVSVTGGATATTNASGVATFSGVTLVGTAGSTTLTFTTGAATATSSAITLSVGAASSVVIGTAPSSVAVATTMSPSPTVTVRDAGNNLVTGQLVTASASGGVSVSAGSTATTSGVGVATFSALQLTGTAGSRTLTFTAGTATVTSSAITLSVGAAASVSNTVATSNVAVGASMSPAPAVTVRDAGNNLVVGQSVTVTASGGVTVTAGGTATTDGVGVATFSGLQLSGTTGSITLTYTAGAATVNSAAFNLTAGSPASVVIGTAPTAVAVAATMSPSPTVTVRDAGNNLLTGASVTITASGSATVLAGGAATTNGSGVATFSALQLTGTPQSTQLTFTAGTATATASAINLTVGAPASVTISTAPSDVSVGVTMTPSPTVTVRDAASNLITGASVTATLSGGRTVTAGGTAVTNGSGVATFSGLQLSGTAGSITVTFTAGSATATSAAINLGAGAPTSVTIGTAPTSTPVATSMSPAPTATVRDAGSNVLSGVTVTASASGGRVVSAASTATTNGSGVATFTGLQLTGTVGSITLTFTAGSATATSGAINLTFGAPTQLVLTQQPSSGTIGAPFGTQPILEVRDVSGNKVDTSTASVAGGIGSGGGSLKGTTTRAAVNGIVTHTDLYVQGSTASKTLSFTSTGLTTATTGSISFLTGAADTLTATSATFSDTATAARVITAHVVDAGGNPVSGTTVTFNAPSAGSRSANSAVTNGSGDASITWTLGASTGTQTITASISSGATTTAQWTATVSAGNAATLVMVVQPSDVAGGSVMTPAPQVRIRDAHGNDVATAGATVNVAVTSAGGTVTATASATTNGSGVATFTGITITGAAGAKTLDFTSTGLSGVTSGSFNLTAGPATQIAVNLGNNQSATVGTAVGILPSVLVTDANSNPVSGVSVSFAVTGGGGSVTVPSATTNASGVATVGSWTLGTLAGSNNNTMTATSGSLTGSPVTFTASATAGAATVLSKNAGDTQTGTVGGQLSSAIEVKVVDANGNVKSGVVVTFTPAGGSGTVGSPTATTDVNGLASVTWTLGTAAGGQSVTATMPTGTTTSVTFNATANPGPAEFISKNNGDAQSGTVGGLLGTSLEVKVVDAIGNPKPGVTVTFAAAGGSGSVGSTTVVTDAFGLASTTWTLGTTAGPQSVTATMPSGTTTTVTFNATATPDVPATITINTQPDAPTSAIPLDTPPVITVTDQYGNPVSAGVAVTLSVQPQGPSAPATLTGTTARSTNASGVITYTGLGINGGFGDSYKITFTAGGASIASQVIILP